MYDVDLPTVHKISCRKNGFWNLLQFSHCPNYVEIVGKFWNNDEPTISILYLKIHSVPPTLHFYSGLENVPKFGRLTSNFVLFLPHHFYVTYLMISFIYVYFISLLNLNFIRVWIRMISFFLQIYCIFIIPYETAVIVFGLFKNFLFKSVLGHCDAHANLNISEELVTITTTASK